LTNSVNTETRRKSERTKVASNEIVYLHFPTGNGGIVLDVSAEGLGFQAADPLQSGESLPFRLSVPGFPEINLSGQIVWLDPTRKRGGMRLSVPGESLALFQKWQRKYLDSPVEANAIPASARPKQASAAASQPVSRLETKTKSRAPRAAQATMNAERQPADSAPAAQPEPQRTDPPPPNPFVHRADSMFSGRGPIFVSEWEVPPEPPRTGRNILVACVIIGLCIVAAGASHYLAGKRAVGDMLINLGQQIGGANQQAGTTAPQPANSGPQSSRGTVAPDAPPALPQNASVPSASASPATVPNATEAPAATLPPQSQVDAGTNTNPAAASQLATPPTAQAANGNTFPADAGANTAKSRQNDAINKSSDSAAPLPDAHPQSGSYPAATSKHAPQRLTAPADNGGEDLNEALVYLGSPNSQDSAVAEDLLWSAISKGNTQADLVLGDLYMRGQGAVRRNCRQAEILLHAALVADVPGASEKMGEMQTYGCH
jgi:hypothetical protein